MLWLLVANLGYLAWSQSWLQALGPWAAPEVQREPQRLLQQLDPGGVTLLPPEAAPAANPEAEAAEPPASAAASAPDAPDAADVPTPTPSASADTGPRQCVQIGALTDKQADAIEPVLNKVLPMGSWRLEASVQPARWVVYVGRLPNADSLASRRTELRELRVVFRDVTVPGQPPGLALGTYSLESSAQLAQRDLARTGVKGAKVVVERPEVKLYMARLPKVTAEQRSAAARALAASGNALGGKALQPCP